MVGIALTACRGTLIWKFPAREVSQKVCVCPLPPTTRNADAVFNSGDPTTVKSSQGIFLDTQTKRNESEISVLQF